MWEIDDTVFVKNTDKSGKIVDIAYGFPSLYLVKHGEIWKSYEETELTDLAQLLEAESDEVREYVTWIMAAMFVFLGTFAIVKAIADKVPNVHISINR